jgi:hypothetical protein
VRAVPIATVVIATGTGVGAVAALLGAVVGLLARRRARCRSSEWAKEITVVRLKAVLNGGNGAVVLLYNEEGIVPLVESLRQATLRGDTLFLLDPYSGYVYKFIAEPERQKVVGAHAATKEELAQAKLNEALALISNGCYRAAILMLGVVLGHSLREVARRSTLTFIHSPNSSIRMMHALARANVIDKSDVAAIRLLAEICDRATFDLTEPSAEEARLATELLRRILRSVSG